MISLITRIQDRLNARKERKAQQQAAQEAASAWERGREHQVRDLYWRATSLLPMRTDSGQGYYNAHFSTTSGNDSYEIRAESSPGGGFDQGSRDMVSISFPNFSATIYADHDFGERSYFMMISPGEVSLNEVKLALESLKAA